MSSADPADVGSVDRLIAEYLAARDSGSAPPPAEWLAAHPAHAPELRAFLADERAVGARMDPLAAGFVRPGQRFGPFVLLRPVATGGMATVWAAEQDGLRRTVALKLLNAAAAPRDAVARFHREAEAVAALNHPHIVPIYKVGEQDGVPYFAMKLAAADLRHRLAHYAARPRAAAELLAKVARAVHHAHLHGVLHRDLKPANILLDDPADGGPAEPLVADFGLAKHAAGEPDEPTRTGAVLGTPGYLSPEQAAGRGNRGTVLTDVWGLGAVLYAVLTGRAPFAADSEYDSVRKALSEEPPRPRALAPGVDADLETVCLKCLEKDPARRYKSAAAVADELDRWLRGETIRARPVGALLRARRWARRNPYRAALAAAVALLVMAVLGAAVVALYYNERLARRNRELDAANARLTASAAALTDSNERLTRAGAAADRARADAERARALEARNSALAREAVAGYDRIGGTPELRAAGAQPVRRLMYLEALNYYQRFADLNGADGPLARDAIDARLKAAGLCLALDRGEEALGHLDAAAERAAARLAADPTDDRTRYLLATAWSTRGYALRRARNDTPAALAAWRTCARVAEPLADTDADAAALLSEVWRNTGRAVFEGDLAAGREAFQTARRYAERAVRLGTVRPPAGHTAESWFGGREVALGVDLVEAQLEMDAGHFARAEERYARLVAGWTEIATETNGIQAKARLAEALRQLGVARSQSGSADPFPALRAAQDEFDRLARMNPAVPRYARDAAVCRQSIGRALLDEGDAAAALPHFTAALAVLMPVTDGKPAFDPEFRRFTALTLLGRGQARARLGRFADAEADFRTALVADAGANPLGIALIVVEAACLQGNHAAAARKMGEMPFPTGRWAGPFAVEIALGWVRCACAAERDPNLPPAERARLVSEYRGRAAAALRRVPDRGNERIRRMLAHRDFWMHDLGPLDPPPLAPAPKPKTDPAAASRKGN